MTTPLPPTSGPTPHNIVLIMVDQLAAKWTELAEEQRICDLPHLRRLRERGTTFTRTVTSNPVCCPTRATIATGLSTRGHGVLENGYGLDPELPTFMQSLQAAGYLTGAFGKLHLRPHYEGFHPDYRRYGFDVTHITEDNRGGEWLDWIRAEHPEHEDAVLRTIWAEDIEHFASYGPDRVDLRSRIKRLRAEAVWATAEFPENTAFAYALPFPQELSQTEWITRHAEDFLAGAGADDRPFFAQVSYVQPHSPFGVPGAYLKRVDRGRIPPPVPAEWRTDPHAPAYFGRHEPRHVEEAEHRWRRACYFADLVHLDEQVGRILAALERTGTARRTYVVFCSDHGELLGDHGYYGKEERHYDACVRVPLYITGPDVAAGRVDDGVAQHEDMCPTICDMAGVRMPALPYGGPTLHITPEQADPLAGTSLLPRCTGEEVPAARDEAYVESYNSIWSIDYRDWVRTVRTDRWRYTYYAGDGDAQLFDLAADPDEEVNRIADPDLAPVVRDLQARLLERIIAQDYPKPRRSLFSLGVH